MNALIQFRMARVTAIAAMAGALWTTTALGDGTFQMCLNGVKVACTCDGSAGEWGGVNGCNGSYSHGAPGTEAYDGLYICGLMCDTSCDGNYVSTCTPPKPCNPEEECCPDIGDPVELITGKSTYAHTDVRMNTSLGPLKLSRSYVGDDHFWQQFSPVDRMPKPFGSTNDAGTTLRWWHNFYSFVHIPEGSGLWHVYGPNGYERFIGCFTPPCWALTQTTKRNRLRYSDAGFEYYDDNSGYRYLYQTPYTGPDSSTKFMLTQVQNENYTTVAVLNYQQPDGGCPVAGAGSSPGTPYLRTVEALGGGRWTFDYKPLQWPGSAVECVLERTTAAGPTGEVEVARYDYILDGGVEMPGFLRAANWVTDAEGYEYTNGFIVDGGVSDLATVHAYDPSAGYVVSARNSREELHIVRDGGPWAVKDVRAGFGDGTTTQPDWTQSIWAGGSQYEPRRYRTQDSCGDNSCSEGSTYEHWVKSTSTLPAGYLGSTEDKRGYFTVYFNQRPDAGVPDRLNERYQVARGATNSGGAGALESTTYTYIYGPNIEQMVSTEVRDSVLNPGQQTTHTYRYDLPTSRRLNAEFQTGYTLVDGGVTQKIVGTFYLTSRNGGAADPLGRTLERRGPCFVTLTTDSDCNLSAGPFPVTQYTYDGDGGRLQKVSSCTALSSGSCSAALDTTYDSYDALGHPTQETDPNGVVTTRTYSGDLVTSETVSAGGDSWTTNFGYDHGKLIWRQSPNGGYEVFCYRDANLGSACSGSWTGRLHWKAKASSSDGTDYSEAVDYEYWPDGTVKTERTLLPGEVVRTTRKYAVDAHRRPTWEGFGGNQGVAEEYHLTRGYNGNDLVSAIGPAFNAPPAFCASDTNHLCSRLDYDRADRLSSLVEYSTSSQGSQTCFGHDVHGNATEVIAGLSPSASCLDGGTLNTSLDMTMAAKYRYDDFGNLVAVTLPWTGSSGGGTTWYEHDAAGNETRKQTPSLAPATFIESSYDPLGRLTQKQSTSGGGSTILYQFQYDTGQPDNSCPQVTYTAGRMARRVDSFGSTWYGYDPRGHVTKEIRLRGAGTTCSDLEDNPHTTYSYSTNGSLASISYPFGRTVTYNYPDAGALEDRVTSISITTFLGDGGTSTLTPISAVTWEPYGALRGYQINHPDGPTSAIEYMLGDDSSTAPSAGSECPASAPDPGSGSDHTGRLRALRVSSGAFDPGVSNGHIYKRTYTWTADQVARIDTCVLDAGVRTETFSYDQMLRLTSATGAGDAGGPFTSRTYAYDSRSNRIPDGGMSEDGYGFTLEYASSARADQLTKATLGTSRIVTTYSHDDDGRVNQLGFGDDGTGSPAVVTALSFGPDSNVATDTVFKSATVNGATYEYYFDAFGRRRAKSYALGTTDELFHSTSNELLVDRGNSVLSGSGYYVEDDYVWLGGRPVMMVRGRFGSSWSWDRGSDTADGCARNEEEGDCGFHFVVTDHIGKPVLMLDSSARLNGVGEYDPFGRLNRVTLDAESGHPFTSGGGTFADFAQRSPPSLTTSFRVRFSTFDTGYGQCGLPVLPYSCDDSTSDGYVRLVDGDTSSVLEDKLCSLGGNTGGIWTSWVTPSAGRTQIESVITGCAKHLVAGETPSCECVSPGEYGVVASDYEYRRVQTGASWFWTPLGFPGQYYDAETDLFENWNRYYDPFIGRYLQPEPLLQRPKRLLVRQLISRYMNNTGTKAYRWPSVYAYAESNPGRYVDRNGNWADDPGGGGSFGGGGASGGWGEPLPAPGVCGGDDFRLAVCLGKSSAFLGGCLIVMPKNPDYCWEKAVDIFFDCMGQGRPPN